MKEDQERKMIMEKKILYHMTMCPFCKKVTRFIEKNNIEDIELRDIKEKPEYQEELLDKGGIDQVPMLLIGDKPMYESGDIIQFLREEYGIERKK